MFKAAPPFSSIRSVHFNATTVGTLMGVFSLSSGTLEVARRSDGDFFNEIFGAFVTAKYYKVFLGKSEKRMMMHNRFVGLGVLSTIFYANMCV